MHARLRLRALQHNYTRDDLCRKLESDTELAYINIGELLKWFVSKTPYLIHDTAKAPHITGRRILLVVYGLN